jgi:uncharacterized protein YvpB
MNEFKKDDRVRSKTYHVFGTVVTTFDDKVTVQIDGYIGTTNFYPSDLEKVTV